MCYYLNIQFQGQRVNEIKEGGGGVVGGIGGGRERVVRPV